MHLGFQVSSRHSCRKRAGTSFRVRAQSTLGRWGISFDVVGRSVGPLLLWVVLSSSLASCDGPPAREAQNVLRETPWARTKCALPAQESSELAFPNPEQVDLRVPVVDESGTCQLTRTGLKRLNRTEIELSMAQLLGVNPGYGIELPIENSENGFDNIATSLPTTPALLEKLNDAARMLIRRALRKTDVESEVQIFEAENLQAESGNAELAFYRLTGQGELRMRPTLQTTGRYEIRVRAFGERAGADLPRMSVLVDGRAIATFDVDGTYDEPKVYRASQVFSSEDAIVAVAFLNDYWTIDAPAREGGDRNLLVDYIEIEGPFLDEKDLEVATVEVPEPRRRLLTCSPNDDDGTSEGDELGVNECARRILTPFVEKAWRRSPTETELIRLLSIIDKARARTHVLDDEVTFEEGIRLAFRAVLLSPHFLYRLETSVDDNTPQFLDDHELASRLSFFLWSTGPDQRLREIADLGWLQDERILEDEVRRMLKDEKARALVDNFSSQWLQTRALEGANPDPNVFPEWNQGLAFNFKCETENLFASVLFEGRSVFELISSRETFASQTLARFYDLPGAEDLSSSFTRVSTEGSSRRGLLTHGSFLAVTSNPTRTSVVKRGKWVLDNLFCQPVAPPPPNVEGLNEAVDPDLSFRERLEAHREAPQCRGCHVVMDPIGVGLENFDGIGRWRNFDGNVLIDASSELYGEPFADHNALIEKLQDDEAIPRCVAEKLLTYGIGRTLTLKDSCFLDDVKEKAATRGFRLDDIVVQVVLSPVFRMTQTTTSSESETTTSETNEKSKQEKQNENGGK